MNNYGPAGVGGMPMQGMQGGYPPGGMLKGGSASYPPAQQAAMNGSPVANTMPSNDPKASPVPPADPTKNGNSKGALSKP